MHRLERLEESISKEHSFSLLSITFAHLTEQPGNSTTAQRQSLVAKKL